MRSSLLFGPIGVLAVLAGCGPAGAPSRPKVETARIVDAIKTDEVHWNADYKSGDAAKIAAHYSPNGKLMVPDAVPAIGASAIEAALKPVMDDPGFTLIFASDKVDVAASGDLAAARGTYKMTRTDPKTKAIVTETGNYITVYMPRPDGTWKAVWDINTPGPAAGAANTGQATAKTAQ